MQIEADPRLAAAAGGAARYLADAAGLDTAAIASWQNAIVAACKEAFAYLTNEHPRLDITLTRTAERLEVALSRQDGAPQGTSHNATQPLGGVDQVQHETKGNFEVTRLTKYITPTSPRR
jgi:hypothetical protein